MRTGSRRMAGLLLAAGLAGCGGGDDLNLVRVDGLVTLEGTPLEGAEVVFIPDPANPAGRPGNDVSGPAGNIKPMTNGRAGLVPGKYKVMVTKVPAPPAGGPGALAPEIADDPHMVALAVEAAAGGPGGGRRKAAQPAVIRGEFEREVPAEGGQIDLDVKAAE